MARPTDDLPRFASGGTAAYTEPGSGKKSQGWVAGELPPAETFNWIHRMSYIWLNYLAGVTGGTEGSFVLANTDTSADDAAPFQVRGAPNTAWKKVFEARAGTAGRNRWFRLYVSNEGTGGIISLNGAWNPVTELWQLSDAAAAAVALRFTDTLGVEVLRKASGSSPWADNGWDGTSALWADTLLATDDVTLNDDLTVGGDASVTGALTVGNSLLLSNTVNFAYTGGTRTVTRYADIRAGLPTSGNYSFDAAAGTAACTIRGTSGGVTFEVPLHVPSGATVTLVRALMTSPTTEQVSLEVFREVHNYGTPAASKVSLRSGGAVSASGGGSDASITFVPNQNRDVSETQQCFARVTIDEDAYVYPQLEVRYTTTNPRHF